MIERVQTVLHSGTPNPFEESSFVSMGGVDYIIGALFILLGLLIFVLFNKKAKANMLDYKKRQLEAYNKNRNTKVTDYDKTKLYLPFWERVKFVAPIMFTILFILVGFAWIVTTATGTPFTTL